jgi:FMN reductase
MNGLQESIHKPLIARCLSNRQLQTLEDIAEPKLYPHYRCPDRSSRINNKTLETNEMKENPFIVGIGGTMRIGSSSEKALLLSLRAAEANGARVEMISSAALELPMYAPELKHRCAKSQRLVELFRECDGVIISSPAYHGSISGLLKNALDYTEDLNADSRTYLSGRAAGLISCGAGWQGAGQTLTALRAIAHSLRAWPTPMGAMLNTATKMFDESGACTDKSAAFQLETVGIQVAQFARMMMAEATTPTLAVV